MATLTRETETYLARFADLEKHLAERGPSSLLPLRREAMARFGELGFPTTKDEEWKYTSVAPIARTAFRPAGREAADGPLPVGLTPERLPFGGVARCRLVFVNGHFAPQLSTLDAGGGGTPRSGVGAAHLPRGLAAGSLAAALETDFGRVQEHLGRYARYHDRAFVALNTAFMEDGAFVRIPRGAVVEEPIHLLFIGSANGAPVISHPRVLIVAEENSQATVIETYTGVEDRAGAGAHPYFTNTVTEIVAAENAVLDHYKVQRESEAAFHVATQWVQQARSSNFSSHAISLGGSLVRNDIMAVLDGPGIESTLNGLYVVGGQQHVDTHTAIDHAQPYCNSHELYKGILDGHATAVFNGKIFVRQDAQKTDAKQTNQNLLLSRDAVIDTKPQLEIFADDVRCTHGATVGQLDADALFYLRSRGIGEAEARGLLTYAFASDILGRIKVAPLRTALEELLFARLPSSARIRND
jgi:Fe-S cluster assembly protein SufD